MRVVKKLWVFLVLACAGWQALVASAAEGGPSAAAPRDPDVYTRGVVQSTFEEAEGRRFYVRLKLARIGKLPFSTITYRVLDRGLVAGLRPGESVGFRAERINGENVLTAIRRATPCQRFQPCD